MCPSLKGFTEFSHMTQVKCSPQNNTRAPIKRRNFALNSNAYQLIPLSINITPSLMLQGYGYWIFHDDEMGQTTT